MTLLGESMGAVLALTTAAELPDRVRRVVAVNPYDYAGVIARSSLLARVIVTGVITPGVGPVLAGLEPKPVMRAIPARRPGRPDRTARGLPGRAPPRRPRPGYSTVARAVYRALPGLAAARARYPEVTAPVHLVYGKQDWSRPSDRQANRRQLPDAEFTEVPGRRPLHRPRTAGRAGRHPELRRLTCAQTGSHVHSRRATLPAGVTR
ncbi:alpha/beta fold hydrolase [Terrabacter sp. MAHUQ-38]|uniref:alpha/beta fold hydrolase n=1 Tax=unclassified Terrabacter TaxID=2630222 RepID=UPI00165E863D|nr:alpha/beta hydrolase [Terrabacter sp. MAHUQ-38]